MKKLRILQVAFDSYIQPYQLSAFRGAIAHKVGIEHEWFHNHDNENGGFHNRYPLIQYKLDTYKGQMRPMLLCLNKGVEEAQHFFGHESWKINLKGDVRDLHIARLDISQYELSVQNNQFDYRLHKWLALGAEHYREYQLITRLADKITFLEKRLSNHIVSFASGVDWRIEQPFEVSITQINEPQWLTYKKVKVLVFTVNFKTNLLLPSYIGLGKGSSMGLGVLRNIPKVEIVKV